MDGRRSALILPVPEAEPLVGELRARYDPVARLGVPAHVTLLYPFLPPARIGPGEAKRARALLQGWGPPELHYAATGRFPGVLYLAPSPVDPLVGMTRSLVAEWPECSPYEGRHADVVPHLTVAQHADEALLDALEAQLRPGLPLRSSLEVAWLITEGPDGRWTLREALPLAADRMK